jgi:hypothetical protein
MTTQHPHLRPVSSGEVFDHTLYGDFDQPQRAAVVQPYTPPVPVVIPPGMDVVIDADGRPRYVPSSSVAPAVVPQQDVRSQRMIGCGVMAFGVGVGAGVAEAGSYLFFAGLSLATHAIIGLAAVFVCGAVALVVVRSSGGVHIGHFHQGDGASFNVSR